MTQNHIPTPNTRYEDITVEEVVDSAQALWLMGFHSAALHVAEDLAPHSERADRLAAEWEQVRLNTLMPATTGPRSGPGTCAGAGVPAGTRRPDGSGAHGQG